MQVSDFDYEFQLALMNAPENLATVHDPVNLGNPGEFTVSELANLVVGMTRSHSPLIHQPLPTDDPRQRRPSIERAQNLLGWAPKVPLHEGLAKTIPYFRAELERTQSLAGSVA